MALHDILSDPPSITVKTALTWSRHEIYEQIKKQKHFDLLIVGGGIHGASVARLAAFNGLKTLLIERSDYASETSGRSSRMAHGGLRYLELFDFRQVFEGIRAREELFTVAPHLVVPWRFLIPIKRGDLMSRIKIKIGLTLYDWLVKKKERKHRWVSAQQKLHDVLGPAAVELDGAFSYTDGIMDDGRIVVETILAARQEGALCVNYTSFENSNQRDDGIVEVGIRDTLSNSSVTLSCGIVVNCAGPWAPVLGKKKTGAPRGRVRYSRGVHLLFSTAWNREALFLPLAERGRYYFVWPHPHGTLVGTTEREVAEPPSDPTPELEEVQEILDRIVRDLPQSGLNRSTLFSAYAGVRTIPSRENSRGVAEESRRHQWFYGNGMLSLVGGKFTTASWTAREGLKQVLRLATLNREIDILEGRAFPGGAHRDSRVRQFTEFCYDRLPSDVLEGVVRRLGGRVVDLMENPSDLDILPLGFVRGEIRIALEIEQVERFDDLLIFRLGFLRIPGFGLSALDAYAEEFLKFRPHADVAAQSAAYRNRATALQDLISRAR